MRLVFCGTPDFAVPALKSLYEAGHEITMVITMPDKPKGRKGEPAPSPVKEEALRLGIKVYQPDKFKTDEVYETIKAEEPDAMIVTAYGKIIPKRILELPKFGCINEHASLLPAYRGAAPIQWAVLDGLSKTGVTIMQMGEGLDDGDILTTVEVELSKEETSDSLFDKLASEGAKLLVETLPKLEKGEITPVKQPLESTTDYARMITKADGKIDFTKSALELERFVRGMNSWPCAYTSLNGKNVKIWKTDIVEGSFEEEPGTVIKADKEGILISTGDGALKVLELQLEGKKRMDTHAFLLGNKLERGIRFGE